MGTYTIAKYLRLSSEDNDVDAGSKLESNSIANQRNLIDSFLRGNSEFIGANIIELCDDGWSGTNFDRPAVQKLLQLVKEGKVQCIIVKDLSRFGRDYLTVGNYISQIFPFLGVRFIAINDGLDSSHPMDVDSLETSFKTLLYDLYSRDLSRKIRSSLRFRAKQGCFLSPFAPYGYVKDPANKNHLLIDPEAAEVVRRIFHMIADGIPATQVANRLNHDAVPTPFAFKKAAGVTLSIPRMVNEKNFWTKGTIYQIVRDERYIGKTIYGKHIRDKVGGTHVVKASREDWITSEHTHEGIVTPEEYKLAQEGLRKFVERAAHPSKNPLTQRVRCGICGRIMNRVSNKNAYYLCETPRYTELYACPTEHIPEPVLFEMLLNELRGQAEIAVETGRLLEEQRSKQKVDTTAILKKLDALRDTLNQKRRQIKALYDSFVLEGMSKAEYIAQKGALNQDCENINQQINSLEAELDNSNCSGELDNSFVNSFQKYKDVQELTADVVADVLSEIHVYPNNRFEIIWNHQQAYRKLMLELAASGGDSDT